MGRKYLADRFYEYYREEEPGELAWLVLYDFEKIKPSGRFYSNLTRAMIIGQDGIMVQYSCFLTWDQRVAKTVRDLVVHYGGDVFVFRGEIVN